MTTTLPPIGQTVRWGRSHFTITHHGCAARMDDCPNGEHAVAATRDGHVVTECLDARRLHNA